MDKSNSSRAGIGNYIVWIYIYMKIYEDGAKK